MITALVFQVCTPPVFLFSFSFFFKQLSCHYHPSLSVNKKKRKYFLCFTLIKKMSRKYNLFLCLFFSINFLFLYFQWQKLEGGYNFLFLFIAFFLCTLFKYTFFFSFYIYKTVQKKYSFLVFIFAFAFFFSVMVIFLVP